MKILNYNDDGLPDIDKLNKDENNLLVFDDLLNEKLD
mgnify:CR=1 FL=1